MYLKLARPDVFEASDCARAPAESQPVRALACATQSVRLTADRRDADRRDLVRRVEPVAAPHPDQLPLALASKTHQEAT